MKHLDFVNLIAPTHDSLVCSDLDPSRGLFIRADTNKYDYSCLRCKCLNILTATDKNGTPLDYTKL